MYKMISLDNKESMGQKMVGKVYDFLYDGRVFMFGAIRSSRVKSIIVEDDGEICVKTKNSTYIFKYDSDYKDVQF